jgi:hypothetical protein
MCTGGDTGEDRARLERYPRGHRQGQRRVNNGTPQRPMEFEAMPLNRAA